jgi:Aspartyl protease
MDSYTLSDEVWQYYLISGGIMTSLALYRASLILLLAHFALDCAAADRPITVPIQLRDHFPVLTADIDGNTVSLVFDSGNSVTIALTQALIDRVKALPTGEFSSGMDAKGNVIKYPRFTIPHLQIGSAVFTDVIAELDVHDPSYQATQVGQQGFLGTALLKGYKVVLDYRHGKITLIPSGSMRADLAACGGAVVPFSPAWHGEPATEVGIDLGQLTVWWDTGAPTSMLSKQSVDAKVSQGPADVMSKRLSLGGTDFGPLKFAVEDLSLPPGFEGFIGYNFFAHHIVCMDFPGKRLLIER